MGKVFDKAAYAAKAREMMAEGIVLLRNDNNALPLVKGTKVALFGRSMFNYYKSGTGSGGMVNAEYVTGVKEAIEQSGVFELNQEIMDCYNAWIQENPYDAGSGWGQEPWFQKEMELDPEMLARAAAESEAAIVLIGRTAGEDQDNSATAGSYLLTDGERDMLAKVTAAFDKTIVLLNVGNIIDMNWVEEFDPDAVLYIWQGGQEGGNGALDILDGDVCPSGKLADTIAYSIEDYPAYGHYGDPDVNVYAEDIYVGYRYFETFAKDKVQYPFGFGLSYTTFEIETGEMLISEENEASEEGQGFEISEETSFTISAKVTNTGKVAGKEVVQVYVTAPQGKLGQPAVSLVAYTKTGLLAPGQSETVTVSIRPYDFASYDDSGVTGYPFAYVLEAGDYTFSLGNSCRDLIPAMEITLDETLLVKQLEEACAPVSPFRRMKAVLNEDGSYTAAWEEAPVRSSSQRARRMERMPEEIPYTGDLGYKLVDVGDGKISMEQFIGQLADEDLICIARGEGMSSPKVTPGTGAAYGGLTQSLLDFGIPTACCSDGPSGIRMDCGSEAFAMPNGTSMACSFNDQLVEEMYEFEGLELRKDHIEALLGPGMNLHRYPLNGRNFEYFSEDPLLTGKMAAAQCRGMDKYGVSGTIKHFAGNNQEYHRRQATGIVSERAFRQLYLKGFEIAVTESNVRAVMTTYGAMNHQWTAGYYDLVTTILRGEWGFDGFVMTDWWANINDYEVEAEQADSGANTAAMVRAQNDVYMVVSDTLTNSSRDNLAEALADGRVTRAELQRGAANVCRAIIDTPAYLRINGRETELDKELAALSEDDAINFADVIKTEIVNGEAVIDASLIKTERKSNTVFQVTGPYPCDSVLTMEVCVVSENPLSQVSMTIYKDRQVLQVLTLSGADSEWRQVTIPVGPAIPATNFFLRFYAGQTGMQVRNAKVSVTKDMTEDVAAFFARLASQSEH